MDRWLPDERRAILVELSGEPSGDLSDELRVGSCACDTSGDRVEHGRSSQFVVPDVIADLNTDRLGAFGDQSQDFAIASHVLEHLADPIGMLDEIHRVLRPGALALVFLPDRRRTRDRFRSATPLAHLVAEHAAHVTEVSDEHLVEFLRDRGVPVARSGAARARTLQAFRDQSIHVHCWDAQEFTEVILWGIGHLGHQWEFVDGCVYEPPVHFEFGYLLRRSATSMDPQERTEEFTEAWNRWFRSQQLTRPAAFSVGPSRLPASVHRALRRLDRRHPWLVERYVRARVTIGRNIRCVSKRVRGRARQRSDLRDEDVDERR